jgi:hypothetical protein
MERMTMISVLGMMSLAVLGALMVPEGSQPMGPASAVGWTAPAVQLSAAERAVEAG